MAKNDPDWAVEGEESRESWFTTLRGVVPFALGALLLGALALFAVYQGVRAWLLSYGEWTTIIELPIRSVLPEAALQPAGTVMEWSFVMLLVTGIGAAWLGYLAVDRVRTRSSVRR